MIKKYQSKIQNGILTITCNPDLKSFDFMKFLVIYQLELTGCTNIIPKLESQTIKKLEIIDCNIKSIKGFQLENIEVLDILNNQDKLESNTIVQEILQYKKLKELSLLKCIIDLRPLCQMNGLNKLSLIYCNLRCIEALRPLVNLAELCLSFNDNINITSVQYLTNLTILQLACCDLVNLDVLRPLKKLEKIRYS
ncbi:leucine-rich_repeat domain-containing protein [Hexamita inflata]|uniref:Leucine-rich repeat domain-containing protein n=1 Tax=Hexamita inflata TaxID=28002 RepID=A0AA86N6X5_9EUKA|nr:leucine-rich repeat domain-containing protein [Hexamita inflata]